MYYDIKVNHLIVDAPRHILTSLRLLRSEPGKVSDIVSPYIQSGAWHACTENLLLSLLASSDDKERGFAVDKILQCRGDSEYGDNSVKLRSIPTLNFTTTTLTDLILWDETEILEPTFTTELSREEIEVLRHSPLSVPHYSCHTQSTERCVKLTTEAAAAVAGQEGRDNYVKARKQHRKLLPVFLTKKDVMKTF